MPKEPLTNKQAIEYLVNKKIVPTEKTAAEIVESWTARDRAEAFFSAQVTRADVLEAIRGRIKQVVEGKMTADQARWWLREFLVTDGRNALKQMGFLADEADMNEYNRLVELGSTRRLKLIIEQNVRNAQAAAEYDGFIEAKSVYPYVEYNTAGDEFVRPGHARWNKTVWAVDSAEARKIWAPNDFNCRCWMRPLRADELAGRPIQWKAPEVSELSPSGFEFDPGLKSGEQLPAVISAKPKTQPREPVTSPVTPEPERAPLELPTGQATAEIIKPIPPKKQWQPDILAAYSGTGKITPDIRSAAKAKAKEKFTGQIVKNVNSGQEIKMAFTGAKHTISQHGITIADIDLLDSAFEIAETGLLAGFEPDKLKRPDVKGIYKYQKIISTRLGIVLAEMIVRETNMGSIFYNIRAKENPPGQI